MEETVKRIASHKGVTGIVILNSDGKMKNLKFTRFISKSIDTLTSNLWSHQ